MNRSDSYRIELSIFEADGTTPLDMSGAVGIIIALYQKSDNIIAKFSLNALTGFTTLSSASKTDLDMGKFYLFLNATENIKANAKAKMFVEVVVEFTNTNFTGGVQRSTAIIELEEVERTILHNQPTS
jgi:type 1 fimbria pilin